MFSAIGRFVKESRQIILAPVLVVSVAALTLYLLGTLPSHLPGPAGALKEYDSIEAAASELGFDIVVPVYFPSYLAWPPDKIRGQLKPFPMVQMSFLSADRHTEILLTYQIVSDNPDLPVALPWIETIDQKTPVTISGSNGELIVGKRANGDVVNAAHWTVSGRHFLVVTTQTVKELLTLARSMSLNPPQKLNTILQAVTAPLNFTGTSE